MTVADTNSTKDVNRHVNKVSQIIPCQHDTIYSPFKAADFEYALDWLADNGFTGVELAITYPDKIKTEKLFASLEARALVATTISTGQIRGLDGLSLTSPDADIRQKAIDTLYGHINISSEIGMPNVTVGLLRGNVEDNGGDIKRSLERLKNAIDKCANHAFRRGVKLQLEPINHNETNLLNTVSETLEFISELGNPDSLGVLYDTYHSEIDEKGREVETIKSIGDKLLNVHFADTDRLLPGYGNIDFTSAYDAIISTGYTGAFALETLVKPSLEFVMEHCGESIFNIVHKEYCN